MTPVARLVPLLLLSACAPSILHFGGNTAVAIPGEVPRDSQGEPVWSAIRPPPPGSAAVNPLAPPPVPVAEGSTP
ncbi:hypothetical protein [Thermaurantiacus sp.]